MDELEPLEDDNPQCDPENPSLIQAWLRGQKDEILRHLTRQTRSAIVNAQDEEGHTLLFHAIRDVDEEMVKALLAEQHVDLLHLDSNGRRVDDIIVSLPHHPLHQSIMDAIEKAVSNPPTSPPLTLTPPSLPPLLSPWRGETAISLTRIDRRTVWLTNI